MLDGREHGGIITADGRQVPEARAVYTRVLTAANSAACTVASPLKPAEIRHFVRLESCEPPS